MTTANERGPAGERAHVPSSAPPAAVPVVTTVTGLRRTVAGWRAAGGRVALVPTLGALHEGHLELVRRGLAVCDRV
ncbi:MAG TPA: pantoate--beta-alanine ligase, partial [Geminicoccaceae bacterium]|nr:pantoate--beta-alanine ligase [Geminicoccaceae bacterium]